MPFHPKLKRRNFLQTSLLGLAGLGWSFPSGQFQEEPVSDKKTAWPRIKEYRPLGRTGFKVSDIAAGAIQDEGVLRAALEAGVNYIDTAEEYPGHHRVVAKAIKGRDRKSIFISTKLLVKKPNESCASFLRRAHRCLEELETDYVDCLMMHMPERVETLKTPGFHQAMQELKATGRVRFVGVSNHGSFWFKDPAQTMDQVLLAAAEDGRFDVFLLAYNFLQMDRGEKVLQVAHEKKIGTALMKTTPIAIYYNLKQRVEDLEKQGKKVHPLYQEGLKRYQAKLVKAQAFIKKYNLQNPEAIKEAAIKFCLNNPHVSTVCCLARTYDEMEKFIRLSGSRLSRPDLSRIELYREGCSELYCRHACGLCEPACPQGVPVNTIMRYHYYFSTQTREKEAMTLYHRLPGKKAEVCQECPGYCETACPYGVPIQGMLLMAHHNLAFP
ncbi:aldo/keto reductase [Candidatus Aminicenantes bacterium AC-334-K16]|jgi:predicted aldo/keto reductase-like oxidoreductase|nr:aldo/keto reductase [Candidatus Aminicenantes bacterium AC-334-K16]